MAGGRLEPLRAVLFDVDFTLAKPGPLLGRSGYRDAGARLRARARPRPLPGRARGGASRDLERHPELDHDEEIWVRFTEDILRGMGGEGPDVREIALEIVRGWEQPRTSSSTRTCSPCWRSCGGAASSSA